MKRKIYHYTGNSANGLGSRDVAELTMIWENLSETGRSRLLAHFRAAAVSQAAATAPPLAAAAMGQLLH